MVVKFDQEKKRRHWEINNCDVDIDNYPVIKPYMEIEGKDWEAVKKTANILGLNWNSRKQYSASQVFEGYGININDYSVFNFEHQEKRT